MDIDKFISVYRIGDEIIEVYSVPTKQKLPPFHLRYEVYHQRSRTVLIQGGSSIFNSTALEQARDVLIDAGLINEWASHEQIATTFPNKGHSVFTIPLSDYIGR